MGNRFDRIVDEAYSDDTGETVSERPTGLASGDPNSNLGVTGVTTCLHCGTCFKALHEFNLHMQIHHSSDHDETLGLGGATNGDKVLKLDLRSEVQRMTDNILNPRRRPEVSDVPHGRNGQSIVKTIGQNCDIYENSEESSADDSLDLQCSPDQKYIKQEMGNEELENESASDGDSDQSLSNDEDLGEANTEKAAASIQDKRTQRGSLEGHDEPKAKRIRVGRSRKSAEKRAKSTETKDDEQRGASEDMEQVSSTNPDCSASSKGKR